MKQNVRRSLYFMWLAIVLGFYLLDLVQPGMFFDGITYAAIAHNMSMGIGSLRYPVFFLYDPNLNTGPIFAHFSPFFSEHPSLSFWLESVAYRAFGDQAWMDKLFLIFNFSLQSLLLYNIVIQINKKYTDLNLDYLTVIIIWLMSDTVRFVFLINFCDNFLTNFCMLSFWLMLLVNKNHQRLFNITCYVLSIVCVFAAMLCNGVVALAFLLVHPVFNFKRNNLKPGFVSLLLAFIIFAGVFAIAYSVDPNLIYNFLDYLRAQVLPSIGSGSRAMENTVNMRIYGRILWYFYKVILTDNIFYLILILLLVIKSRTIKFHKAFWCFMLMFILATLPIVVATPRAIGSLRFFDQGYFILSLAQAILLSNSAYANIINATLSHKIFKIVLQGVSFSLLIAVILAYLSGHTPSDRQVFHEVKQIGTSLGKYIPGADRKICSPDIDLVTNTILQSYLIRYQSTNIVYSSKCDGSKYILSQKRLVMLGNYTESQINNMFFYTFGV